MGEAAMRILRIAEAAEQLGATRFAVARMIYGFLFEFGDGYVTNNLLPGDILSVPDRFYVVLDGDVIVAVGAINLRNGYISRVCVRPSYRRRGLATMLNLFFFVLAYEYGLRRVWCYVDKRNTPIIRLLVRLGFKLENATPTRLMFVRVLKRRRRGDE